jgi:phage protein D
MVIRRDSPVIQVRVGAPDGELKRIDDLLTDRSSGHVIGLTFEDDEKKIDKLTLLIDNFDLSHIDSSIWRKGNRVEATWGYVGLLAPIRSFTIQKVEGSLKLKVVCEADDVLLNREKKNRTWENVTFSDIARTLAREHNFGQGAVQFIQDTTEVQEQVTQARQTDYQFLKNIGQKIGFDFFIDFDGWHFHPRNLSQKPLRTFIYYTDPGMGDIISWNLSDASKAKPGKITLKGRDPIRKTPIEVVASNDTVTDRTTLAGVQEVTDPEGAQAAGATNSAQTATSAVFPTVARTQADADRKARGVWERTQLMGVELSAKCVGDPRVIAKTTYRFERIGPTMSGLYYCKSVKHSVGTSGFTIDMKLMSDGKSQVTNSAFDELPGQGGGVVPKATPNKQTANDASSTGRDDDKVTAIKAWDPLTGQNIILYKDSSGRVVGRTPASQ